MKFMKASNWSKHRYVYSPCVTETTNKTEIQFFFKFTVVVVVVGWSTTKKRRHVKTQKSQHDNSTAVEARNKKNFSFSYCQDHQYCPLLKRIQLSFTARTYSFSTRNDCDEKTYRSCQKHESLSHRDLSTDRHLFGVSFLSSLKSNLCTALITQNTTQNKSITFH
jgi:hypothetical protein